MIIKKPFKLAAVLCALILAASVFTACSGGEASGSSAAETTKAAETTEAETTESTTEEETEETTVQGLQSIKIDSGKFEAKSFVSENITVPTLASVNIKPFELKNNDYGAQVESDTGAVTLDASVMFATDSYEISESGKTALKKFLDDYCEQMVSKNKDVLKKIAVEGHTDTQGSREYNQTLSEKRAKAVLDFSVKQHPELKDYLYAVGRAFDSPVYNSDGSVNMEKSRRVVFVPETE